MWNQEVQSLLKNIRVSPRKLSLVAGLIRGLPVGKALDQLTFSRKRIAVDVKKGLLSAIANAENNHGLDIDRLYISEIHVGKALSLRRFRARAKGRPSSINKPFSHLTIKVSEKPSEELSEKRN